MTLFALARTPFVPFSSWITTVPLSELVRPPSFAVPVVPKATPSTVALAGMFHPSLRSVVVPAAVYRASSSTMYVVFAAALKVRSGPAPPSSSSEAVDVPPRFVATVRCLTVSRMYGSLSAQPSPAEESACLYVPSAPGDVVPAAVVLPRPVANCPFVVRQVSPDPCVTVEHAGGGAKSVPASFLTYQRSGLPTTQ